MLFINRQFKPTLFPTLAFLLIFPGLIALGFWQLDRREQKQELFALFDQGASGEPIRLNALSQDSSFSLGNRYRAVTARGSYDGERQFLMDNMISNGRVGYYVLTPFVLEGGSAAVIVNRGWVPQNLDRQNLPDVSVTSGSETISGRIDKFLEPGVRLETKDHAGDTDTWPKVVQFPKHEELQSLLPYGILGGVVLLDKNAPRGYKRQWRPAVFGPERHLAYAFQWFALAFTLLVIYIVLNFRKLDKGAKTQ
ncbi:MAG: SURF1 family protein [Gammaproteobacteria bacterium]|nr:SURF1 family protein [Gammaproteobacteria bacterium]